jgi:polyisoprenoid-binding protein YceI/mono/diheme cytochrome c family protein
MKRADEVPEGTTVEPGRRRSRVLRWVFGGLGVVVLVALAVGIYAWTQYRTLTSATYQVVDYSVPNAPHLVARSGETVYRVDPTHSSLSYAISEKLFGHKAHTARGTTNGIAGEVAVNEAAPARSRVGQIVANVEQLHSDNNLRDAKMRQDNLDSHDYPLARLTVSKLHGMPARITEGTTYRFSVDSRLVVKNTPAAVRWNASGTVADGRLSVTATAKVKLSTWHIGPISISGLVSTSDDVTLTMKLTALDPSKHDVPTTIDPPKSAARPKDSPSFEKVVMPLLRSNCASCHNPGEVGADHWKLVNAGDAADVSDGIGTVVGEKYMPPWPASTKGVPLAHSRALDQKSIDAIVKWAKAGGPLDVPRDTKITPLKGPVGPPPRHDVVMKMPEAYAGSLSVPNDYRCFVLDPHITKLTYVTGFEVLPDKRPEIHHVQLFHVSAAEAQTARSLSGKDGKPGWSCYGSVSLPTTRSHDASAHNDDSPRARARRRLHGFTGQAGLFAGWVPGQDPVTYPENLGVPFEPGDAIVFQIHYHYDEPPVPDRSTVTLQLDEPTPSFKPVDIINPIAPVEIPCMPGQRAALCDRDKALQDDVRLYGGIGAGAESGLLLLCDKTPDELAATFHNGVASSSCDYRVPEDGTIISVFGHEHTLGKTFRLTLDPGTSKPTILLDIPTWNFDWQMNYGLETPVHVKEGQTIRMECSWDRALDPNRAPKYIVFAEGTEDEMCFGTYAIVPDNP